jgi:ubiquinone/menaquinone biosynthesis C-methylase UbiE
LLRLQASEAYDKLASLYDQSFCSNTCRAEDELLRRQLDLQPGDRVLDVGCGTGLLLELFPHLEEPDSGYVGVDASAGMLHRARQKFPESTFLQLKAECMTLGRSIAIRPGTFDVVVSLHTLGHAAEQQAALEQIRLALRPGGRYLLTFFGERYRRRPSFIMNRHQLDVATHFFSAERLALLLARAGYGPLEWKLTGLNVLGDHLSGLQVRAIAAWMRLESAVFGLNRFYHLVVDGRKGGYHGGT